MAHEKIIDFPVPERIRTPIRVCGVGRVADNPCALLVTLSGRPTDSQLRAFHEFIKQIEVAYVSVDDKEPA